MSLSTERIRSATIAMANRFSLASGGFHLDIGAGHGELIGLVQSRFKMQSRACDYTAELMMVPAVAVDIVDLNHQKLPYPDQSFDLVTCTEVVEHVENPRFAMREAYRVLRPGGVLVVTTPNVLNLRSRLRYFAFGFASMFGPIRAASRETTDGHITPISHFFLTLALKHAGFSDLHTAIDKWQRRSVAGLILFWLPVKIAGALTSIHERRHYGTIDASNKNFVNQINSLDILLGRTIIVGCRKPPAAVSASS